ncbi:conserved exported hypothetical protein [uncultured Eubacteriales bacterium]|uniref:DUF4860 domain-containing protein n=1 Tax=uncultured Eubacteriales bacterium TaxID=172733 RepID=A0A212JTT3_9FIRM|nr:conserved exported hypothetical protein [uncultured Eubacteriales bacterium]
MKNERSLVVVLAALLVLICIAVFGSGVIGVSRSNIEENARQSQRIDASWLVAKDVTDEAAALLFYNKELNQHTFSIYLNNDGFSYGYFFREGGSLGSIDSGIQGFSYQSNGLVLLSMNAKNVEKIQMNNGKNIEIITINPLEPFAIIIPSNIDTVTLYNSNGENISIDNIST